MPVVKRMVSPVQVARQPIASNVTDPLEAVAINSLSGLVSQLSNISRHAADMFDELLQDSNTLVIRTNKVKERMENVKQKLNKYQQSQQMNMDISALDSAAFQSDSKVDQQIISRMSLPGPVLERYMACQPPPPLNKMNPFRKDDKISLTYYTDPDFFFRKWVDEQQAELKSKKKGRRNRKGPKKQKNRKKVAEMKRKEFSSMGAEFDSQPQQQQQQQQMQQPGSIRKPANAPPVAPSNAPNRPNAAPPPPPMSKPTSQPPPPPPANTQPRPPQGRPPGAPPGPPPGAPPPGRPPMQQPPPPMQQQQQQMPSTLPPGPPPPGRPPTSAPPPPMNAKPPMGAPPPPAPPPMPVQNENAPPPPPPMPDVNSNVPNAPPPPPMGDANPPAAKPNTAPPTAGLGSSGFLSQLQAKRTNMKEVVADDRQRAPTASDDVTAILMRRMAMEMSDSEGSGSEEDDWSSEEESD